MSDRGWLVRLLPLPALRWAAGAFLPVVLLFQLQVLPTTVWSPYRIPTASMAPTVLPGDLVAVWMLAYGFHLPVVGTLGTIRLPRRGDVALFRYPRDRSSSFIARVVALPGDRVQVAAGQLVVDGQLTRDRDEGWFDLQNGCDAPASVPRWVERAGTREYAVVGSPSTWPPDGQEAVVPEGAVFVLGDARDLAEDSRHFGFVPVGDLIGRVTGVWYSTDPCSGELQADRFFRSIEGAR